MYDLFYCALVVAKIKLRADEEERRLGAVVLDLRNPLYRSVHHTPITHQTFSFTFSNEAGDTTEKHTRKTSVWG